MRTFGRFNQNNSIAQSPNSPFPFPRSRRTHPQADETRRAAGGVERGEDADFRRLGEAAAVGDLDGDGLPDAWEIAHGLDPADDGFNSPRQGAAGDFDGDGLPNLAELALGLDPAAPNPDALPFATIEKNPDDNRNYLVFTFRRPFGSSAFAFAPEACVALGGAWNSTAALFQEISATPDGGGLTETAKVRVLPALDAPGGAPCFIRLRVSAP